MIHNKLSVASSRPSYSQYSDTFIYFAAIVARVTTLKRMLEYQPFLYNFRIQPIRIFRQEKPIFVKGVSSIVLTPRSADLCHAKVKRGEVYLLGGRVKGRRVFLTSCGLIEKWNSLEHIVRKAIRLGKLSCKCTVQGCDGQNCLLRQQTYKMPVSHSCENVSRKRKNCYSKFGVCILKNNRCKWAKRSRKLISNCVTENSIIPSKKAAWASMYHVLALDVP